MAMQIGQQVRQITPVIQGEIVDINFNKADGGFEYLVAWTDDTGTHTRWFDANQVEVV